MNISQMIYQACREMFPEDLRYEVHSSSNKVYGKSITRECQLWKVIFYRYIHLYELEKQK